MATTQVIELLEQLKTNLISEINTNKDTETVQYVYETLAEVGKAIVLLKKPGRKEHVRAERAERENDAPQTRQNAPSAESGLEAPRATRAIASLTDRQNTVSPSQDKGGLEDSQWAVYQTKKTRKEAQKSTTKATGANTTLIGIRL